MTDRTGTADETTTAATSRERKLTRTQRAYLDVIRERGHLTKGWGGYGSTLVVRILNERGLVHLREHPARPGRAPKWTATPKGRWRKEIPA